MKAVDKMTLFLHLLNCFFLIFVLFFSFLVRFSFLFQDLYAVFVWFQSSVNHLAGVNAHIESCTISLLLLHFFSVVDTFLPVNLDCFANLLPFVVPSYNLYFLNFIILLDGQELNLVLLYQLFRKRRRHNFPVNVGRHIEMCFLVLAQVRNHKGI